MARSTTSCIAASRTIRSSPARCPRRSGAPAVSDRLALLRRFIDPQTVFLEIGAGDGSLTLEVARHARKCYALDVSREILSGVQHPRVQTVLSDGCSVPVPANTVTLAYSFQVMEHIHPDDALEQLRNLFAVIAPDGSYVCVTPNRLNGPHDVSKFYDPGGARVSISRNTPRPSWKRCFARWASARSRRIRGSAAATCVCR